MKEDRLSDINCLLEELAVTRAAALAPSALFLSGQRGAATAFTTAS